MNRVAVRAIRTTSLSAVRTLSHTPRRGFSISSLSLAQARSTASAHARRARRNPANTTPLRSSMYFRRLPLALVSSLVVGYGAWYSYNGSNTAPSSATVSRNVLTSTQTADALPTRTVLVVGADELRQGTIVGEGPISKATRDDGRRIVEMLTPEQATDKLRRLEQSFSVNRGHGVTRYDVVQLPSNDPIEDDHAEKIVEVPNRSAGPETDSSDWMFWGVFDGHSGWTTSATLRESLINYVARELNDTYKKAAGDLPSEDAVSLAIKTGFTRLDNEIVHKSVEKVFKASSKTVAAELLQPALSGSCALLSFYDSRSNLLRVACTGDSRAVLGRRSDNGKWTATALSEDQTGSNPEEVARMRKEHPGEENVIRNGRVLGGLEPSRAFGDAVYKWSRDVAWKLRENFFGRSPSPLLKTPPYVTAEPIVTTTKVNPEKGDFLVLATDGLWEMLTNEEVVGLVGKWIETQGQSSSNTQFDAAWNKIFGSSKAPLPVEESKTAGPDGNKTPIRLQQWGIDPDAKDRFVVKDKNVATHLIRNALGGTNDEQVCALLTLPSPFSRRYRDDLTVQVIFFGHGEKTGEVTVNLDASTGESMRAKL
ncbi:PPM-type phosphatase domain-containing protein [Fusarium keratoplasticum]|uniref:PPM-type phosphatase domain-containing protein n=1 Tax=Fusarium keratoplasticum TaxID=1328300 RepID=A0ACC0R1T5_9HYPO|nr:PPM-type phosphatase domain-containing protein [Fusarium keratoplasticum]KAI8670945.1 PPM-type phosphatase domain-containing protein [Fusarium keratoplasticum]KAI8678179.1 PPM-type phosphatase domain-containing protein [Fusarium keratoplasticum]